jgi:tetratricopeptide (TPR) repeat protein
VVPLLEDALAACTEEQSAILGTLIMKIGELPGPLVAELLIRALSSPWKHIRFNACIALAQRRSRRALPALVSLCEREPDPLISQSGIVAAVASGPRSVEPAANYALWGALGQLAAHPRLRFVDGYDLRLAAIASMQISRFEKDAIVRVLESCPRAYVQIESMLFKSAPFETYFRDEVDQLDDAADRLFGQFSTGEDTDDRPPSAHTSWMLDELLARLGQTAEPRPLLEDALPRFESAGNSHGAAVAAYRLGELDGREGGWESARRLFERGIAHAKRADEAPLIAEGYRLLADAALHGSDYENAQIYYQGAIRGWDALGRAREAADARLLLVVLLIQLGRPKSGAGHVGWLRDYEGRAELSQEERGEVNQVLRLAEAAEAGERETAT